MSYYDCDYDFYSDSEDEWDEWESSADAIALQMMASSQIDSDDENDKRTPRDILLDDMTRGDISNPKELFDRTLGVDKLK